MSRSISVIAAHADDEALGCGGTIARWSAEGCAVHVLILADGVSARHNAGTSVEEEAKERRAAADLASAALGCASLTMLSLPDNRMDSLDLLDVVKLIEAHIREYQPSTILTHHQGDVNIDHRIIHDAVVTACRPQPAFPVKELLFFEVASSTEWRPAAPGSVFAPNYYVDISTTLPRKRQALEAYRYEMRDFPHPRSIEAIEALARWRGASVGVEAAEAFLLGRKIS